MGSAFQQGQSFPDGSVSTAKLAAGAVTPDKQTPTYFTNSISGDVLLNNTSLYFDGPSVAQGTAGTWLVFGHVTLYDTTAGSTFKGRLWDGTTVISSGGTVPAGAVLCRLSFSGIITNPTGNLRISVRDFAAATGKIIANDSGDGHDSMITAIRIG